MRNPVQIDQDARNVAFAYIQGTNEIAPLPMNSDGSIRIEIHPVSASGAVATRHRYDENSRWTGFGLDSTDSSNQLPLTMTNLGGTAPAVRIDINVL